MRTALTGGDRKFRRKGDLVDEGQKFLHEVVEGDLQYLYEEEVGYFQKVERRNSSFLS